ncbi:MAG: hypothetical protein U9O78_04320 [Patescibacteria group bacterium]|nr:hypothetical protein [Patescibacteria group bacterium]
MSIKLTKKIKGKKVELDIISLDGKATVRHNVVTDLKKKDITEKDLKKAGFATEK